MTTHKYDSYGLVPSKTFNSVWFLLKLSTTHVQPFNVQCHGFTTCRNLPQPMLTR